MQGGLNPDLRLDYHVKVLSSLRRQFPQVTLHVLSPVEIHFLSVLEKADYRTILEKLREDGMDSLPGGGAEILVDSVRERLGSKKCSSGEWLAVMKTAHELGIPTTATMMFGHVESLPDRIEHLRRIRDLQDETGGFTAFIPWTYQPGNTVLGGRAAGGAEYLRTLAVSRLYLDNVSHIQASWLTQGLRIGELALRFGADDLGGTLLEENVVRSTGLSVSSSEEELRRVIRRAGFLPYQRDTQYNCLERLVGRNE
jgi:cyclic dehypoxanthinyl futalosine synthase